MATPYKLICRLSPTTDYAGMAVVTLARSGGLGAGCSSRVPRPHSLADTNRCSLGRNRKRRLSAPNVGMRCGLPVSSRQCDRCRDWSSIYAEGADMSEPASVSPSRHHRNGFNRNVAHDIPYFAPRLASANERQLAAIPS